MTSLNIPLINPLPVLPIISDPTVIAKDIFAKHNLGHLNIESRNVTVKWGRKKEIQTQLLVSGDYPKDRSFSDFIHASVDIFKATRLSTYWVNKE